MKNERKACGEDAALGRLLDAAEIRIDAAANERFLARLSALPPQGRGLPIRAVLCEWFGVTAGGLLWPRLATLATASVIGILIGLSDLPIPPVDSVIDQDLFSVVFDGALIPELEE